jgi:hypothetical protein
MMLLKLEKVCVPALIMYRWVGRPNLVYMRMRKDRRSVVDEKREGAHREEFWQSKDDVFNFNQTRPSSVL